MLVPAACPGVLSLPTSPELAPNPGPRRGRVARAQAGHARAVGTLLSQPRLKPSRKRSSGEQRDGAGVFVGWHKARRALRALHRGEESGLSRAVPCRPSRFPLGSRAGLAVPGRARPVPPLEPAAAAGQGRADGAAPAAVTNGSAGLFK